MATSNKRLDDAAGLSSFMRRLHSETAVMNVELPIEKLKSGKVREVFVPDASRLLIVATDRISTFDVVHPDGIPQKGKVLNRISNFWFNYTKDIFPNHVLDVDPLKSFEGSEKYKAVLEGRSVVVTETVPFPVECIVRGYLTGSGLKEYKTSGTVTGIPLPQGLKDGSQIPEPIFTPSTKAESGHDVNIPFSKMIDIVGKETAELLRDASLKIFAYASEHALKNGIILADTKFEFGQQKDTMRILLIDEALTPDSSRFWPLNTYKERLDGNKTQHSFDKQYVRDYVEGLGWNKTPPAPSLSSEVITNTTKKYIEAYERLTRTEWSRQG